MIKKFIERYELNKDSILRAFKMKHPESYKEIVKLVIENVTSEEDYAEFNPDPERIHEIDDGCYQGTLLYVIAAKGYQPDDYFYVKVGYGSCSGCDTLEGIRQYDTGIPTDKQAKEYLDLARHIVCGLKKMDGYYEQGRD